MTFYYNQDQYESQLLGEEYYVDFFATSDDSESEEEIDYPEEIDHPGEDPWTSDNFGETFSIEDEDEDLLDPPNTYDDLMFTGPINDDSWEDHNLLLYMNSHLGPIPDNYESTFEHFHLVLPSVTSETCAPQKMKIEFANNEHQHQCQLCFYTPEQIPRSGICPVKEFDDLVQNIDEWLGDRENVLLPSPCESEWNHSICLKCLKQSFNSSFTLETCKHHKTTHICEVNNTQIHQIQFQSIPCLYPYTKHCKHGYSINSIQKLMNHTTPNELIFGLVSSIYKNHCTIDMKHYCGDLISCPTYMCVQKKWAIENDVALLPLPRNTRDQPNTMFCRRCENMELCNVYVEQPQPCYRCATQMECEMDNWWNRYIVRPQWMNQYESFVRNVSDEKSEWEDYQNQKYIHLVKNKHLTVEMIWGQMENLLKQKVVHSECFKTGTMIYKTDKCNGLSHCGIEKCYISGRTTPLNEKLESSHWNPLGHCGAVPRFDNDPYWNQVAMCNWICQEGKCYNENKDCTNILHAPGIKRYHEERKYYHVFHLLRSIPPQLKCKIYEELDKYKKQLGQTNESVRRLIERLKI